MAEPDPIRQLQHLLDDPGKLLERISRIQSVLGSIRSPSSTAPETPATSSPLAEATPDSTTEDRTYDDLLQILRDMQTQIEQRVRPLALQSVQAQVEHLRELAKQEQIALNECITRLDQNLLTCVDQIDESRQLYAELTSLNHRLTELGVATEPLPEISTSPDPREVLKSRVEGLRARGKI